MKERFLLRIAMAGSLIGLVLLFIISERMNADESTIARLEGLDTEANVEIKGVITDVNDYGKLAILKVSQPTTIEVMIFKDGNISLSRGDYVSVKGEVREYKSKKEIIADEIKVID